MCATTPKPECTENAKLNNGGVIDYTEVSLTGDPIVKNNIANI